MRFLLIFILIVAVSCKRDEPLAAAKNNSDTTAFRSFGYDYSNNYLELLPKSIMPGKPYQYWAYVEHINGYEKASFEIFKEAGDTLLRRGTDSLPASGGFFKRGQFTTRGDFIVVIENDSLSYISTDSGLREFLGTIDNVNEAVLLAETFHYGPDYESGGNDYRIVNGAYELNLIAFDPFPSCVGGIEYDTEKKVTVTKDGFIKAVSREKNNTSTNTE
ncbi:hypothetical protein ACLI09_07550 [Flavobacterium sp. RHBU_24]|uniref:hypothetical protein n=1 Tax=Flavobacterium sp. RHBU_24 TaxID=3391185 RepID=UPI003984EB72